MTSLAPAVRTGRPYSKEMKLYTAYLIDGINIWKADNIKPYSDSKPITIELEKWWLFNKLTIDGAKPLVNNRCM